MGGNLAARFPYKSAEDKQLTRQFCFVVVLVVVLVVLEVLFVFFLLNHFGDGFATVLSLRSYNLVSLIVVNFFVFWS